MCVCCYFSLFSLQGELVHCSAAAVIQSVPHHSSETITDLCNISSGTMALALALHNQIALPTSTSNMYRQFSMFKSSPVDISFKSARSKNEKATADVQGCGPMLIDRLLILNCCQCKSANKKCNGYTSCQSNQQILQRLQWYIIMWKCHKDPYMHNTHRQPQTGSTWIVADEVTTLSVGSGKLTSCSNEEWY